MKIISKHKDFYDYLVGIYGEDEKLVFDRRQKFDERPEIYCLQLSNFTSHYLKASHYVWHALLFVGHALVHVFKSDIGEIFTSFDLTDDKGNQLDNPQIAKIFDDRIDWYGYRGLEIYLNGQCFEMFSYFGFEHIRQFHQLSQETFLNRKDATLYQALKKKYVAEHKKSDCDKVFDHAPILLIASKDNNGKIRYGINHSNDIFVNPILQEMGMYFDPTFVWQKVSEYLGTLRMADEVSPPVPNDDKIVNKGFDVKRSFRPKMK